MRDRRDRDGDRRDRGHAAGANPPDVPGMPPPDRGEQARRRPLAHRPEGAAQPPLKLVHDAPRPPAPSPPSPPARQPPTPSPSPPSQSPRPARRAASAAGPAPATTGSS